MIGKKPAVALIKAFLNLFRRGTAAATEEPSPADLAEDIIRILKKNKLHYTPCVGARRGLVMIEISQKICAGASVRHLAEFLDKVKRKNGYHFIAIDQTLLHLFAGEMWLKESDWDVVIKAFEILTTPDPETGILHFDIDYHDCLHGRRPLHLAAMVGHPAICRILLEAGADPIAPSIGGKMTRDFSTPLELALARKRHDSAAAMQAWLSKVSIDSILKPRQVPQQRTMEMAL